MEIILIRHTKPLIAKGICYGQSDLELADSYSSELVEVKNQVKTPFDQVFSSPLRRCAILANDLFPDVEIKFDDRIKELDFGDWEMVPWNEMDKDYQEKWMANFVDIPTPGGESLNQMNERIVDFLQHAKKEKYSRIALVTHSGVIRIILARIAKTSLAKCFSYDLSYGVVKSVILEG